MLMEITDISSPSTENFLEIKKEEQKEINKSVIEIICEILFENGDITYDEKKILAKNAIEKI